MWTPNDKIYEALNLVKKHPEWEAEFYKERKKELERELKDVIDFLE